MKKIVEKIEDIYLHDEDIGLEEFIYEVEMIDFEDSLLEVFRAFGKDEAVKYRISFGAQDIVDCLIELSSESDDIEGAHIQVWLYDNYALE